MNDFDWNIPRLLAVVGDEGSLSRGAKVLGMSQPTLGRQIAAMEAALGTALIVRSPRGVVLTEHGAIVAGAAGRLGIEMARIRRLIEGSGEGVSGWVRVGASEVMGLFVLPPILGQLQSTYPDLRFDVVLDNEASDILGGDVDVAIRLFRPTQLDLVSRYIGKASLGLFATEGYVSARGPFERLEALEPNHLIGYSEDPWLRSAFESFRPGFNRDAFGLRTDNQPLHIMAARSGLGVGSILTGVAGQFPELVQILPDEPLPGLPMWVVQHLDTRGSKAARVVFDALCSGLAAYGEDGA